MDAEARMRLGESLEEVLQIGVVAEREMRDEKHLAAAGKQFGWYQG
jgi:hypothetical protein